MINNSTLTDVIARSPLLLSLRERCTQTTSGKMSVTISNDLP
ncbi:MAG: hypothetical protein AB4352_05765 [Hormoscilla sp.]